VTARGAVPLVTWEPWVAGAGVQQPAYALDRITAGDFDPYLRRWADGLRAFGRPVLLRFAHEMNGDWYPWAEGVNGNGPGDYVAAWHHVRGVVTGAGASNVSWVWSPNVPYTGSVPLPGLYPGAGAVDVVGLDGYNFGTSQSWSSWVRPDVLFGPGLAQLRQLAPGVPVVISETASSELGGSKADWVRSLFSYLAVQPDVTAVVWFHFQKETDWRLDSSSASAAAVREALLARRAVA
jgi:beta-mannanase